MPAAHVIQGWLFTAEYVPSAQSEQAVGRTLPVIVHGPAESQSPLLPDLGVRQDGATHGPADDVESVRSGVGDAALEVESIASEDVSG